MLVAVLGRTSRRLLAHARSIENSDYACAHDAGWCGVADGQEVVLSESLFRPNKWMWLFGWLFHLACCWCSSRHLRYFTEPVWFWVGIVQPFGRYASITMVTGLAACWHAVSWLIGCAIFRAPSDYLMLVLLIAIGLSGLLMSFVTHTDIMRLKLSSVVC